MAYCGPKGIALDDFLRWSRRSQEAALAWQARESQRCRNCGTHPEDWADDALAHHAHLEQCKGCQQQQRITEAPEADERGVYAVVRPGPAMDCPLCKPMDDD